MFFKNLWFFRKRKNHSEPNQYPYFSTEKVYTPVSQLAIGMYIVELDRPWLETPFLFQGFELKNQAQIDAIKDFCNYVYVDRTKTKKINYNSSLTRPVIQTNILSAIDFDKPPPDKFGTFEREILRAENIYANTEYLVANFMKTAAKGAGIDGWLAKKAVAECINSVMSSPDAMLWLTQMRSKDKYTMQHSLNVSVLAIIFGRYLNLPNEAVANLGLCGMMHDIGKMQLPMKILHKRGKLDDEEMEIMKTHTTLGFDILKSSEHFDYSVALTALTHHVRIDGTGYPKSVKQTSVSDYSKIISIVDAYDAMLSNKPYETSKTHLDAIATLMRFAGQQWDRKLVIKFIESLGVYPPGSLVLLTNGFVAIVIEVNDKMKLRPKIILLLDQNKQAIPEEIIDLSQMACDKNGEVYTIKSIIKAEDWNIDASKYINEVLIHKVWHDPKTMD